MRVWYVGQGSGMHMHTPQSTYTELRSTGATSLSIVDADCEGPPLPSGKVYAYDVGCPDGVDREWEGVGSRSWLSSSPLPWFGPAARVQGNEPQDTGFWAPAGGWARRGKKNTDEGATRVMLETQKAANFNPRDVLTFRGLKLLPKWIILGEIHELQKLPPPRQKLPSFF
jgi:hypothetical protein